MTTNQQADPLIGRLVDGRYRVRARIARLVKRLESLDSHLPADPLPESLASAHGLLGRLDGQLDAVILAARRRGE